MAMLISQELNAAFNDEIGLELFASNQYLNMAAYLEGLPLKKLAAMFEKQAEEERGHALKFVKYLNDVGGAVVIPAIPAPKPTYASVEEVIQESLKWETEVTNRINAMMTLAIEKKDYAAQDFLRWFVTEQVEEMATFDNLLKVVKAAGERSLIMVEAYLVHQG
jgi:bacterioferritin B